MSILDGTWLLQAYSGSRTGTETTRRVKNYSSESNSQFLRKQIDQQLKCLPKAFAKLSKASAEVPLQPLRLEFHLDVIETNNYYPELSTIGLSLKIGLEGTKPKNIYCEKNIGDFLQAYEKGNDFLW